jgi:capsular polysaccharide biosynthesis protein
MKRYRETVRRTIAIERPTVKRRILITRKQSTNVRRIINQEEIAQTVKAFGFQSIHFEDLSLREQLQRALSADAMIGAHGSGLCHSLFMDEGSTLIELFPFARKQSCDCYERLATIPQHRYHALETLEDREGDIVVSPSMLLATLKHATAIL